MIKEVKAISPLFILATVVGIYGLEAVPEASDGWKAIEISKGLPVWHANDSSAGTFEDPNNPGQFINYAWQSVGGVKLDPANPKRFILEPGDGVLVNGPEGRIPNIFTNLLHADCELHIEFNVPQGSNSGVYFMSHHEIQVLDSHGVKDENLTFGDCGGVYARFADGKTYEGKPPRTNASRAPGQWQTYVITYRAPKFNAEGTKIADARFVKVTLNGIVIHENIQVSGPTRAAAAGPEKPRGPLMLQGDHGPVAFRNIRIRLMD